MNLPASFTYEQQIAALKALGLAVDAEHIASVLLDPGQTTVVTYDLNADGRVHLGPDGEIATTTTVIPMVSSRRGRWVSVPKVMSAKDIAANVAAIDRALWRSRLMRNICAGLAVACFGILLVLNLRAAL